jgi:hypothetical protein
MFFFIQKISVENTERCLGVPRESALRHNHGDQQVRRSRAP